MTRCESGTVSLIAWHEACFSWYRAGRALVGARQQQGRGAAACSETTGSRSIRSVSSGRWSRPRQTVSPSEYEQLPGDGRVCQAARNPQGSARRHGRRVEREPPSVAVGEAAAPRPRGRARPCENSRRSWRPGRHQRRPQAQGSLAPDRTAGASRSPTGGTDQGSIRREPEIVIRTWSTSAEQRWVTSGERRSKPSNAAPAASRRPAAPTRNVLGHGPKGLRPFRDRAKSRAGSRACFASRPDPPSLLLPIKAHV